LVHKEQATEICPKSNALAVKNMDTTKGIVPSLRRNNKRKREEAHITQDVKEEDKKQKKGDPPDLYYG